MANVIAETNIRDKIKIKSPTELIAKILDEFSAIILNYIKKYLYNDK